VIQEEGVLRNKTVMIEVRFMKLWEDCNMARTSNYSRLKSLLEEIQG
jgi:hypothetical protein